MAQSNRLICVFGDSYVKNHRCPIEETWHWKVACQLGLQYLNLGINGNCIGYDRDAEGYGNAMIDRIEEIPDSAAIILIIAGHNDAAMIKERKDYTVKDFSVALDTLLKRLTARHPETAIGYVTPWNVDRQYFPEIISEIKRVCKLNGIPVLDTSTDLIEVNNPEFRKHYFQGENDTAHLNDAGHNLMVGPGLYFIESLLNGNAPSITQLQNCK